MKIVYVPAGEFVMGGEVYYDERPIHIVDLDAYWIDQTEVTNGMFAVFLTEEGNREEAGVTWLDSSDEDTTIHLAADSWQVDRGYEEYPVGEVTWYGANAYCSWAGRRLPTEAEWEKAARGTNGNTYPWGNNAPTSELLNFNDNVGSTTKIGSYPNGAGPYGALDMAGNVWEWVADRHSRTYYATSPPNNPLGPETGFFRVLRGGAWNYRETYARSVHRNRGIPTISHDFIGFRCARDAFP
jgi:serine/threonine-protein kinase